MEKWEVCVCGHGQNDHAEDMRERFASGCRCLGFDWKYKEEILRFERGFPIWKSGGKDRVTG